MPARSSSTSAPHGSLSGDRAELLEEPEHVALRPVLGDPAVLDPADVDAAERDPPAGGRDADELSGVRGRHRPALDDPVTVDDLVMDGVLLVGERLMNAADEVLEALAISRHSLRGFVLDEAGG